MGKRESRRRFCASVLCWCNNNLKVWNINDIHRDCHIATNDQLWEKERIVADDSVLLFCVSVITKIKEC